jgi:ribulose bisphosphate carboxylase small subunit
MRQLTKIEQLDQPFPGLANQVRAWFDLGMTAQRVAQLLREQYQVSVPRTTVGNFRTRRWARERELQQARRAEAVVTAEFARMQKMKAASGSNFRGLEK